MPIALRALLSVVLVPVLAVGSVSPAVGSHGGGSGAGPLTRAHAHNDEEHARPLRDALAHGFASVEVDVWLVDGELLVGHDREDLAPGRSLESLYLDPLAARARAHAGEVYAGDDDGVQLLVDLKNAGARSYEALHERLRRHRGLLTTYAHGRVREKAVTVLVSGARGARTAMEAQQVRLAFHDGRPADLGSAAPASLMPLVSDRWSDHFSWDGVGAMPAEERARLRRLVATAHAEGRRVRFWGTPDGESAAREAVWRELLAAGVDHVNTDDLAGLEAFLRQDDGRA